MFLEFIIAIVIGVFLGCITGLIPGIHINMVAVVMFTISPFLLLHTSALTIAVVIVSMGVTHTFLDAIPSIFLGAPDADHALSVLPGHRLLLKGQGYQAVTLTAIGSLLSVLLMVAVTPLLIPIVKNGYPLIQKFIPYLIIIASVFLIIKEKKSRFWAVFVYLVSGVLGIAVLGSNVAQPLFPLFSGLFGTSILILSILEKTKIPKQKIEFPKIKNKELAKSTTAGFLASFLTGLLPGLGAAQAAIIASSIFKKMTAESFLVLTGAINTFVMIVSFIALFSIDKARNGAVVIISKILESITIQQLTIFLAVTLVVAGVATILTMKFAKVFTKLMTKVSYQKLAITVIILITGLVIFLTGPLGLLILIVATFTGMIPSLTNIGKNHLMGSLLLPVILFLLL